MKELICLKCEYNRKEEKEEYSCSHPDLNRRIDIIKITDNIESDIKCPILLSIYSQDEVQNLFNEYQKNLSRRWRTGF